MSKELTDTQEGSAKIGGEEAENCLYQVWYKYELSSKQYEDNQEKQIAITKLSNSLSIEATEYLDEQVEIKVNHQNTETISRGILIRLRATRDAIKTKVLKKV